MLSYEILYKWPDSQICSECKYGVFVVSPIDEEYLGPSAYICRKEEQENDGVNCRSFKEDPNKEREFQYDPSTDNSS